MTLKKVMDRNGVKGRDMAEAIGVAVETVSRWRSLTLAIGGANLIRVRDYLRRFEPGIDVQDLRAAAPARATALVRALKVARGPARKNCCAQLELAKKDALDWKRRFDLLLARGR